MSNAPGEDRTTLSPSAQQSPPAGPAARGEFAVGDVIAGSYRVLSFIGRGGMGAVYRVRHLFLDKELALKTLSGDQITEVAWKRFQIEGQAIARLDHPNIIRIYDLGIVGQNQPYYVMDVVDGVSLSQLIKDQGALRPERALPIFRQISAGLAYAHDHNIIHRDLKPANIMLLANPPASASPSASASVSAVPLVPGAKSIPTAKILDFGLAKLTDLAAGGASGLTRTGEIFGSPLYMSPEQAQGLPVDAATDIYSFGCTLYEALTGQVPLRGANALETMLMHQSKTPSSLSAVRPDLEFSRELESLVLRLLAKRPEDRYRSFAEVSNQLLLIERRQPGPASTSGLDTANLLPGRVESSEAGAISQSNDQLTDPPGGRFTTKPWFWPTVLVVAPTCLVLLGLASYYQFTPKPRAPESVLSAPEIKQAKQTSLIAATQIDDPARATQESSYNYNLSPELPFYDKAAPGTRGMKKFEFPEKSIGSITFEMSEIERTGLSQKWHREHPQDTNDPYAEGVKAQRQQIFPAKLAIGFKPSAEFCETPGLFKRFNSDDLYQLNLSNIQSVDSDLLHNIKHLSALYSLKLDGTEVDDRSVKVLDSMPGLGFISIDETRISGTALAESAFIKRISHLSYNGGNKTSALLKAIQHNDNIRELDLSQNQLTTSDVQILSRMPKLSKLCVNYTKVGDEGLKILAQSKSITHLDIRNASVTPASIKTFATMKLEKLSLSESGWSKAEQIQLASVLKCKPEFRSRIKLD